jgi:uncharacterized membrane protein YagU involved in acid resistance
MASKSDAAGIACRHPLCTRDVDMRSATERLILGAIAGLAATVPMTCAMSVWHRCLPRRQQDPLPPAKITDAVLRQAGWEQELSESAQTELTLVNHFGYGAATGACFESLRSSSAPPTIASGCAYGLGVWAGSYLIWLPAAGLHRSALQEPLARNLLMIGAHLVWGTSLALFVNVLTPLTISRQSKMRSGFGTRLAAAPSSNEEVAYDMHRRNQRRGV